MFSYHMDAFILAYSDPQRKHFSEYMDLTYIFFLFLLNTLFGRTAWNSLAI